MEKFLKLNMKKIPYAAKEIHRLLLESAQGKALENIKGNFLHECHIWNLLRHPRITQIIGLYSDNI